MDADRRKPGMLKAIFKRRQYPDYEEKRNCIVKMNRIQRKDGARVFYRFRWPCAESRVLGSGSCDKVKPDIALLGGWSTHPAVFLSQIKELCKDYRVLTMETRGYWNNSGLGKSTPETYLDDCVQDLRAVLDTERIGSIAIVGHSMWGGIAMNFYHSYPSMVSGLVLVAPGYTDPRKLGFISNQPVMHKTADILFHVAGKLVPLGWVKKYILSKDPITRSVLETAVLAIMDEAENKLHARKMIKNVLRADLRAMSMSMQALFRMDDSLLEKADEIKVPVLLIGGSEDPLVSPESVIRLGQNMPCAQTEIWDGVKHFPMIADPEKFNRRLAEFLNSIHK